MFAFCEGLGYPAADAHGGTLTSYSLGPDGRVFGIAHDVYESLSSPAVEGFCIAEVAAPGVSRGPFSLADLLPQAFLQAMKQADFSANHTIGGKTMRTSFHTFAVAAVLILALATSAEALETLEGSYSEGVVYDIPRVDGITIDGLPDDWGERGFRVDLFTTMGGEAKPPQDFDLKARLGWNGRGLAVLVTVTDDVAFETTDTALDDLFTGDCFELMVAEQSTTVEIQSVGYGSGYYQLLVGPGWDPKFPRLRSHFRDHRENKETPLAVEIERTVREDGYVIELLLPWANTGMTPKEGATVAFQMWADEYDIAGDRFVAFWYPVVPPPDEPYPPIHVLRLSEVASEPVRARAAAAYENGVRLRVDAVAQAECVGSEVVANSDGQMLGHASLHLDGGRARSVVRIPTTQLEQDQVRLQVRVADQVVSEMDLPSAARARSRAVTALDLDMHPYVFRSTALPRPEFDSPIQAEALLGPYQIRTTYYDRDYREVTSARSLGRYGAVVEIVPEAGRSLTYYRTIFRSPEQWPYADGWHHFRRGAPMAHVELPPGMAVTEQARQVHAAAVDDLLWSLLAAGYNDAPDTAAVLAALYEAGANDQPVTAQDDAYALDRQWWVGLKRKLSGMDGQYPEPLVCPRPIDGPPAPVLREGTSAEAGMDPSKVEALDALLEEWAANSDEGFGVCIARRGVVVLHQAYGKREGRAMEVTDQSWMASMTKLISATLMMMLVDQDLVDLDDPVEKYLPAFRGTTVEIPQTVRRLYNHTNGYWDHWGDELHDFDQLMAYDYPQTEVGVRWEYNGAGYALGGKIVEMVSGEAIPLFYQRHLLGPLGCEHTSVTGTSGDAASAPLDMAKIGQMLLNKGAYGDQRFFSEATFEKMLPCSIQPVRDLEWGMGCEWVTWEGLGKGAFGHGAASKAIFRVNPENDLVIVMTRNRDGLNYLKYAPKFMAAVIDAIEK